MCNKPIYKLWQATAQYKVHSHIHVRLYAFNDVYSAHLLYNRNVTLRVPVFYILLVTLFATEKIVFEVIMSDTNVSTRAHVYTRAHIRTYTHTHTHTHTHTQTGIFYYYKAATHCRQILFSNYVYITAKWATGAKYQQNSFNYWEDRC